MDELGLNAEIRSAWGWLGLEPVRITAENDFGNLIIEDVEGAFWRLCPEECTCTRIASNSSELQSVTSQPEFAEDWSMARIVEAARDVCGPLTDGKKYALKIPACLGGEYTGSNFTTLTLPQLISFSGTIAFQAKDLPAGAKVELKVMNHPDERP